MATVIATSLWPINDSNGDPVSGALIYVYAVGTTTPKAIYSDTGLSVSVSNPIVANSAGRTTTDGGTTVGCVFTATGSYKLVIKTSGGTTLYTLDNIDGGIPVGSGALAIANGGTAATSAATALSNLGGASAADLADLAADVAALTGASASTEKTHLAAGTTAQRPASPAEGDVRRNTSTSRFEVYDGSAWVNIATTAGTTTGPTYQSLTTGTAATYTTPAGVKWLRIHAVGGGGGTQASSNVATDGGATIWDTAAASVQAAGGVEGGIASTFTPGTGGAGGTGGSGTATFRRPGEAGQNGCGGATIAAGITGNLSVRFSGGQGGRTMLGPGGRADTAGTANTGGGGGGISASQTGTGSAAGSGAGGGGEYFCLIVNAPSATYLYTIGAAGTAGTSGVAGGSGWILVEEHYV